jgi:hypothetical protein
VAIPTNMSQLVNTSIGAVIKALRKAATILGEC